MRARICVRRGATIAPRCSSSKPQKQQKTTTTSDPYAEILRIRAARKRGISLSLGAMAASVAVAVGSGVVVVSPPPPPPLPLSPELAIAAAASVAAASAAAKVALGDRLHVELEGLRPFIEVLPPFDARSGGGGDDDGESVGGERGNGSSGDKQCSRPDGRPWLVVKDVGDGRGKGVYVASDSDDENDGEVEGGSATSGSRRRCRGRPLPRGAFLGCYEGDLLDERSFWGRYPLGVGDYCIGCGGGWCLDGAPVAERLRNAEEGNEKDGQEQDQKKKLCSSSSSSSSYSPCLINHSSTRHNVTRITRRSLKRVELYASRDIEPGEEVLLDYGRRYWLGREAEEKE